MSVPNEPRPEDLRADREAEGTITDHLPDPGWRYLDLTEKPPIRPASFAPLIGVGELVLITGPPAAGKTSALTSMAAGYVIPELADSVLGGALIAERDLTTPSQKILLIDGETGEYDTRRALFEYISAAEIDPSEWNQHFIHAEPHVLDLRRIEQREDKIREQLREFHALGVRVVAVDSTLTVFQPNAISDASWVSSKLVPLRNICRSLGMTTLVLCHPARGKAGDPKPRLPLGSTGQEIVADAVLHVEPLDSSEREGIRVRVIKRRRPRWVRRRSSVKTYFTSEGHYECDGDPREVWPLEPPTDSSRTPFLTPQQEKTLQELEKHGPRGTTASEVADQLGVKQATALDYLGALRNKGLAQLDKRGPKSRWSVVAEEDGTT